MAFPQSLGAVKKKKKNPLAPFRESEFATDPTILTQYVYEPFFLFMSSLWHLLTF